MVVFVMLLLLVLDLHRLSPILNIIGSFIPSSKCIFTRRQHLRLFFCRNGATRTSLALHLAKHYSGIIAVWNYGAKNVLPLPFHMSHDNGHFILMIHYHGVTLSLMYILRMRRSLLSAIWWCKYSCNWWVDEAIPINT